MRLLRISNKLYLAFNIPELLNLSKKFCCWVEYDYFWLVIVKYFSQCAQYWAMLSNARQCYTMLGNAKQCQVKLSMPDNAKQCYISDAMRTKHIKCLHRP